MPTKPRLVVLTGAGISAESGLQTFRDADGLWEGYNIEEVATPQAWKKNPELVLDFYNFRRKKVLEAGPNAAHYGLVELEEYFEVYVITQNIDDLHERAGSSRILHLHGEIMKMRSEKNENLIYPYTNDLKLGDLAEDGHQLRPHIVWFGEPVPMMEEAIALTLKADYFAVIGTSLVVYPAAGLVDYCRPGVSVFILDKKIPNVYIPGVTAIKKPAAAGIQDLKKALLQAAGIS